MAISINGVSQITSAGSIKNNQPANPVITKVGFNHVYNGTLQPDFRLTNPGVTV